MSRTAAYRDPKLIGDLAESIEAISRRPVTLMEVCGSHTMAIQRFGIRSLLPDHINLVSGPGCPVCVTDIGFIDTACAMASRSDVTITTFGDLIRVPGSISSLEQERASGGDIRVVQSSLEALRVARENPDREVVFLGIGFETTAPTTAAAIQAAANHSIRNFSVLSAHKTMKPAMLALIADGVAIDGYICPGHVSIVTGAEMYREIVDKCQVGCVVAGFEPADILHAVYRLVVQAESSKPAVEIAYKRAVTWEGNRSARALMNTVFVESSANWRGIGDIAGSGLVPAEPYEEFDALERIEVDVAPAKEPVGCRCGEILKGTTTPVECPLFGTTCTPESPVGACMVSSEGTCAAYYRYQPDE